MASSRSAGLFSAVALILGAAAAGIGWHWASDDKGGLGDGPSFETGRGESEEPAGPGTEERASAGQHDDAQPARIAVTDTAPSGADERGGAVSGVDPEQGAFRVRGVVVDLRGAPIDGARLTVVDQQLDALPFGLGGLDEMMGDQEDVAARTGEDGAFDVAVPGVGAFRLLVAHDEHPSTTHRGDATEDVTGVRIVLRDGAAISGRVVGAPQAAELGGARLVLCVEKVKGAIESVTSGAVMDFGGLMRGLGLPVGGKVQPIEKDRGFRVAGLAAEESYRVWAARVEGEDETAHKPVCCTTSVTVRAGAHGVELVWRDALTVGLRVVDADSGQPLERLDVSAGFVEEMKVFGMSVPLPAVRPLEQKVFKDGIVIVDEFEVRDEQRPIAAVEVRADGRRPWIRHDIDLRSAGHFDLGVVRLERAAVVVVRVFDPSTGAPIEGADVQLVEIDGDAEGGGGRSISVSANVATGRGGEDEIANVLGGVAMTGSSDAGGICRITAEFRGRGRVEVESDDYADWRSAVFDVPERGDIDVDAPQSHGGSVRVVVTDGHGEPAGLSIVRRTGPMDDSSSESTDERGVHVFERLALGEHEFRVIDADANDSGPVRIAIAGILDPEGGEIVVVRDDGVVQELTLSKPLLGRVVGFVTVDGEPFEGAGVRLSSALGGKDRSEQEMAVQFASSMLGGLVDLGNRGKSDAIGRFEMDRVAVGSYRLLVSHRDLAMPDARVVQIVEGDNNLEVPVRVARVRGRVVDASGAPVARAKVSVIASSPDVIDLSERLGDAQQMMGEIFGRGDKSDAVRTDSAGRFELRGVRAGAPLLIRATARMHTEGRAKIDAVADGSTSSGVELVLGSAGRIRVVAKNLRGANTVDLEWAEPATGDDAPRSREALLRHGRSTVDGLRPGRWTVTLSGIGLSDAATQPRTVVVVAGETQRVEFGG